MNLGDFDYHLPKELIAQKPAQKRDRAKLLVLNLKNDEIEHKVFYQITDLFRPNDIVVINNTRVVNARVFGHKPTGGKVELLLLNPYTHGREQYINRPEKTVVECLIKGRVRPGNYINLDLRQSGVTSKANIIENIEGGRFKVEFDPNIDINRIILDYGSLPLPPYIKSDLKDPERYQTVYSKISGSVAAPTAGLHFTQDLINNIKKLGVRIANVTLHISYGTFTPVRTEDITLHKMDSEYAILTQESADLINEARNSRSGRLVAVGTTSVRTLESAAAYCLDKNKSRDRKSYHKPYTIQPWEGWTDLFIYPGYKFKAGINILITNFHLPKSTLLMLVCAFAGREKILRAYQEAIEHNYRFYSLGDSMLIIK